MTYGPLLYQLKLIRKGHGPWAGGAECRAEVRGGNVVGNGGTVSALIIFF